MLVMPTKVGIPCLRALNKGIPAFAGMTTLRNERAAERLAALFDLSLGIEIKRQ
jgi:hypothetical protein